jgi:drug/metabolite transporter (DMT)-like permease
MNTVIAGDCVADCDRHCGAAHLGRSDPPNASPFSFHVWLAVIVQGILPTTAAFLLWNWGLARVPAARAGVFLNLEPLVGTLLGLIFLNERLGAVGMLGALILFSAAYFSRPRQCQR